VMDAAEAEPKRLASLIERLMESPAALGDMAEAARRLGRPRAADAIARDVLRWAIRPRSDSTRLPSEVV
jgi:UDP-N-acetylglucosamine:LPS N-acetylglucosamine transferase